MFQIYATIISMSLFKHKIPIRFAWLNWLNKFACIIKNLTLRYILANFPSIAIR